MRGSFVIGFCTVATAAEFAFALQPQPLWMRIIIGLFAIGCATMAADTLLNELRRDR
jgi:hypothetical protein